MVTDINNIKIKDSPASEAIHIHIVGNWLNFPLKLDNLRNKI